MDFFFRGLNEDSSPCPMDMVRCPFLRNINEPTNFSFSSAMPFHMPVRGTKGPIFEDEPNFDAAFRLFHGSNGVVPLSERSFPQVKKVESKPASPQFNPLAARAATISLSFRPGGPFGFDAFSNKWKNQRGNQNHPSKSLPHREDILRTRHWAASRWGIARLQSHTELSVVLYRSWQRFSNLSQGEIQVAGSNCCSHYPQKSLS